MQPPLWTIKIATIFEKTISCQCELRVENAFGEKDYLRFDVMLENTNQTVEQLETQTKDRVNDLLASARVV